MADRFLVVLGQVATLLLIIGTGFVLGKRKFIIVIIPLIALAKLYVLSAEELLEGL